MELRQLRAFLEVVTQGHFGRAAARLNLTQPALTQRIQSLERELGVQVLSRNAREVRLTPAGEVLLPYATTLVRLEDRAVIELSDFAAGLGGRMRIAYMTNGDVFLPGQIIAMYRERYPSVSIETSSGSPADNIEHLQNGDLDAAFLAVAHDAPDGLALRLIAHEPIVVAVPTGHRLAAFDPVPVTELAGEALIIVPHSVNPIVMQSFERWLTRHIGERPNIIAYEPSDQALESVAQRRSAGTFVSLGRGTRTPVPGIDYRRLTPSPTVDLGVAYLRGDPTPTLANLLAVIDEVAGPLPGAIEDGSEMITFDPD
jgi:DNA-binding transcriptional LysR family regulator